MFCISLQDAVSLEREYFAEEYCCTHQPTPHGFNRIQKYMPLIPGSKQCLHMHCSKCNDTWVEYYIHDEDDWSDEAWTEIYWNCKCKDKFLMKNFNRYWDSWMPSWTQCAGKGIYDGYFSPIYTKYASFFDEYLQYITKNPTCNCFWPEISKKAARINDAAYNLFKNLLENTALSQLVEDVNLQKEFFLTPSEERFNLHGITIFFVCHSLLYSDYDWISRDLEFFSSLHFDENSIAEIKNSLDEIKATLAELFLDLYRECLKKHPHLRIEQELYLVKSYLNLPLFEDESKFISEPSLVSKNSSVPLEDETFLLENSPSEIGRKIKSKIIFTENKNPRFFDKDVNIEKLISLEQYFRPNNWEQSDVFLSQGTFLNDLNLYSEATELLTQSIQLNPSNRIAYVERAIAYFETNQLPLALEDFEAAKKLSFTPPFRPECCNMMLIAAIYVPENKMEFSTGLVSGTLSGAKISAVEFIPSFFSCLRGISSGLWAFTCSPVEVSKEMLSTAYAIGEFISNNSAEECIQCVVPELRDLSLSWHKINDYSKGQKIGFIIGKYGVDIFAPYGFLKGANKFRALKRANAMYTLENCAASQVKYVKILEESVKKAFRREKLIVEATKKGTILIKSSNAQYHIMQKKHAWDKVVKLSGNIEEDFKKVILLLEENSILSEECFLRARTFAEGKIIRSDYQKIINGHKVEVTFETYVETNQIFLQDAWVVTK